MDKKWTNMLLAGAGIGLVLFIAFQALTGGFSGGKVYFDENAVVDAAVIAGVSDEDVKQTAQNYNALGYKLLSTSDSMCVSPNMIASNIGYYYEGAVDDGKQEAATLLGSSENVKEKHGALVNKLMNSPAPEYNAFFNGLFMDKNTKPKEPFLKSAPYYGVYFETCDFYDFVATKNKMDAAASKQTDGKITQAIDAIYPNSSMVFTSALNVKYRFTNQVGKTTAETGDFNGKQVEYITIDKALAQYAENDKGVYVKLPLENGYTYEVTMAKDKVSEVTLADIKELRESAKEQVISITLPKPQFSGYYELKQPLKQNGFSAAFDKTTIIMDLTDSVKTQVDKMDHTIAYELLESKEPASLEAVEKTVNINKPYYYFAVHEATGMNIIMGKSS